MEVDLQPNNIEPLQQEAPLDSPEVAEGSNKVGRRLASAVLAVHARANGTNGTNGSGVGAEADADNGPGERMEGVYSSQTQDGAYETNGTTPTGTLEYSSKTSRKRKNDEIEDDERSSKRVAIGDDRASNILEDTEEPTANVSATGSGDEDAEGDIDPEHNHPNRASGSQPALNASGRPQRRAAATAVPRLSTSSAQGSTSATPHHYALDDSGSGEEEKDDEEDELYAEPHKTEGVTTRSGTDIYRKPRRSRTGRAQNEIPAYAQSAYYAKPNVPPPVPQMLNKKSRGRLVPAKEEDGRKYKCNVCSKVFARGEHLKRHIRSIHTDEKPYECPYPGCGRSFSRTDNMMQHMRTHTDWPEQPPAHLAAMAIKAGKATQQKLDASKKAASSQEAVPQASTSTAAPPSTPGQAPQVAAYPWFTPGSNPPGFVMLPIMGQAADSTNEGSEKAEEDEGNEVADEKQDDENQPSTSKGASTSTKSKTKTKAGKKSKKSSGWQTNVPYGHSPFMIPPSGAFGSQAKNGMPAMIPFYPGMPMANGKSSGASGSNASTPMYAMPVQYPPGTQTPAGMKLPPGVTPMMMIDPKSGMMMMAAPAQGGPNGGWIPYPFMLQQPSSAPNSGKGKGKSKSKAKQDVATAGDEAPQIMLVPAPVDPAPTRDVEDGDLMSEDEEEEQPQGNANLINNLPAGNEEESEDDSEEDSDESDESDEN